VSAVSTKRNNFSRDILAHWQIQNTVLFAAAARIVQSIFGEMRLLMQPFPLSRERRNTAHKYKVLVTGREVSPSENDNSEAFAAVQEALK